jgi:hypothetical protein
VELEGDMAPVWEKARGIARWSNGHHDSSRRGRIANDSKAIDRVPS